MNLKKYSIVILFLLSGLPGFVQNVPGFFFWDNADVQSIRSSASADWGEEIVADFRNTIQNRSKFSLDVPRQEGSYLHEYFCPVHSNLLLFDWDSPNAHYCENCRKYLDDNPRYNRAWIAIAHTKNMDYLLANMYMYVITDSVKYAENARLMLKEYALIYPSLREHNRERFIVDNYSARLFSQSLDEAVWAIDAARVYHSIKPFLEQKDKSFIEANLLKPCTDMLLQKKDKGNWQAWHNGAIVSLGVALENDSIINVAIDGPEHGYNALLKNNVYADGWWNEGSVVYHFYPLKAIIQTAEAARCRGKNLYNEQLYAMFMSPVKFAYSDLSFPSQNDGWYGTALSAYTDLYEIVAKRFNDEQFRNLLSLVYVHEKRKAPEALLNGDGLASSSEKLNRYSSNFPNFGVAMLRSNNKTVAFKYGPHGGVHGHFDKLSISIHDGEEEILPDLGTTAYSLPVYREWYRNTFAHNTITVDAKNQQQTCGELLRFKYSKSGGKAVATSSQAYTGVKMLRWLKLRKNTLKDIFVCKSDSLHTYDYVLISNSPVSFKNMSDTVLVEYKSLENTQYFHSGKKMCVKLGNANVQLKVNARAQVQVFTSVAPGIPPAKEVKSMQPCYPVIIRTQSGNLRIRSKWEFMD